MEKFFVIGGVFKNAHAIGDLRSTNFHEIEAGTHELYGPFDTEAEAEAVERAHTATNRGFDICWHKVFVLPWTIYNILCSNEQLRQDVNRIMFKSKFNA